ncbi:hypothetical protein J2S66_006818 [Saccharothrix longispora]|uniref:PASTA domain-containing protein n=1 Tax=Saccharothrix longispora TaxID=33920 RepID=A0ABU1Q7R0_9PSEU|nr:PASTA domain-containing protein [Saccharothrix longispora]MDR6598434.1 hypothetical protein [Saccharothrix longispora]
MLEPLNWVVDAQLPEGGARAPRGTRVLLKVGKPTDSGTPLSAMPGTVPDVVCLDLQSAQEVLRAAGFYNLGSEDVGGGGRLQVVDRNWVVLAQSAAAGSTPEKLTRITLGVVKFGEPAGASGCRT